MQTNKACSGFRVQNVATVILHPLKSVSLPWKPPAQGITAMPSPEMLSRPVSTKVAASATRLTALPNRMTTPPRAGPLQTRNQAMVGDN